MIRVLIVDDHSAFSQPLAIMLSAESDIEVVGQAGSLEAARQLGAEVDVAVIDLDLPDGDGAQLIPELHRRSPGCAVVVLTASTSPGDMGRAITHGAIGWIHKSAGLQEIITAVRRASGGESLITPWEAIEAIHYATREAEAGQRAQLLLDRLTRRETDVLAALSRGLSDREIGASLDMATETVRTHMVNILAKLEVESRLQAAIFALQSGVGGDQPR